MTWPSGLQAPGMDTDGEPGCLDYVWLRGASGSRRPGSSSTGRTPRTRRSIRATTSASPRRLEIGYRSGRRWSATLRLAHRGDWRHAPREQHRRARGRAGVPGCDGLEFDVRLPSDGVPVLFHDETLERVQGRPERVDGCLGRAARAILACRRWPMSCRGRRRRPSSTSSSRATSGRPSSRCSPPAAGRASNAVVSSFEPGRARAGRPARSCLAALAQRLGPRRRRRSQAARRSAAGAIAVEWHALDRGSFALAGRPASRSRPGPSAAARRSTGWRGWASSRSASRPPPSTAERGAVGRDGSQTRSWTPRCSTPSLGGGMTDRADLVVVGAGTVGGWASVFAAASGVGRVVVLERGLAGWAPRRGPPASSAPRAARRPRSRSVAGRSTSTAARPAAYGTDSGFRELGYLILAVTEEDERAGRERVAMQHAAGLDVRWLEPPRPRPRRGRWRPTGIAAAASRRRWRTSTRRGTCAPTRWRCRRPASSYANGRRSPACG